MPVFGESTVRYSGIMDCVFCGIVESMSGCGKEISVFNFF